MIKKFFSNRYLLFISRLVLGSVFIIASIDKIALPEAFAANVQAYRLAPFSLVNIFALVIPWAELVCGIFLIAGVFIKTSSLVLSSLLLVFTFAIISALLRGLNIDCGCFGVEHTSPVSWMRVLEDVGLMVLGMHIFIFSENSHLLKNISSNKDS